MSSRTTGTVLAPPKEMRTGLFSFILPIVLSASSAPPLLLRQEVPDSRSAPTILLADTLAQARDTGTDPLRSQVDALYEARAYEPLFMDERGRRAAAVFIDRLDKAHEHGLEPTRYDVDRWRAVLDSLSAFDPEAHDEEALVAQIRREIAFTTTLIRFGIDLAHGGRDEEAWVREVDVPWTLASVIDARTARQALATLAPPHAGYRRLASALTAFRQIAHRVAWSPIREDLFLRPALTDGRRETSQADEATAHDIASLCGRLLALQDLPADSDCAAVTNYGPAIEAAVRRFQARHGLTVDGIVGPRTVEALNVSPQERLRQIRTNMNRWRRLPDDLGARHVRVNIPAFQLRAFEHGREALRMAVVVGEPDTPTPEMRDDISYLEFRPYWNVPRSITEGELLPRIIDDPDHLREAEFEIVDGWNEPASIVDPATIDWASAAEDFPYRLRQRPGGQNALGLVKFMFPNDYNVYLHDTPADHRFEARHRAFSHGCVRVADPVALAGLLLQDDPQWTAASIRTAMHGGERQVVPLPENVPVYLTYFTAWVDAAGVMHFRADLYGRDQRHRPMHRRTERQ